MSLRGAWHSGLAVDMRVQRAEVLLHFITCLVPKNPTENKRFAWRNGRLIYTA
jgi:hypothetical protein